MGNQKLLVLVADAVAPQSEEIGQIFHGGAGGGGGMDDNIAKLDKEIGDLRDSFHSFRVWILGIFGTGFLVLLGVFATGYVRLDDHIGKVSERLDDHIGKVSEQIADIRVTLQQVADYTVLKGTPPPAKQSPPATKRGQ